jgi:quercetin dioxygenase-like cupin family protein
VLEPHREDVWIAVEAEEAKLGDDRAAKEVGRARVQSDAILGAGPRAARTLARSKVLAMAVPTKVKLLTDHDLPYTDLVPGLELSRSITHAGTTQLGGGYMRFSEDAEFPDWTLKYDEVLFVQSGELEILSDGASVMARSGQAILIPRGARVTYRGRAGTVGFFVLWPFDWDKKTGA